jgi:hypothetical protein
MEIIEIITPLLAERPRFTVDNTAVSVAATAMSGFSKFYNGAGKKVFQSGDNVLLLSAGYILPEMFTLAQTKPTSEPATNLDQPNLSINSVDEDAGATISNVLLDLIFPMGNFELPLGVYYNSTGYDEFLHLQLTAQKFTLRGLLVVNPCKISMVNVPDKLQSTVQYITPFIKVLHNKPLTDS